ncbi:DUF1289 domain-containing protein [Stieleria maiorica]|uniref:DUF1289 domain-containing protein n=1 Tax=Stieleria maiorica TaxID=2795974 RepID=UPI0011CB543A
MQSQHHPPDPPETVSSQSPCVDHCALDAAQTCLGCFRTLDEIARWSVMSEEERRETNRRCRQRRQQA